MRVLLVHATPLSQLGGAELSLSAHVASAPPGIRVETVFPDDPVDVVRYDTIILANLRPAGGFWERAEYAWAKLWTRRLRGYRGYVIRSERDMHPCFHRDGRCIGVDPVTKPSCKCRPKIGAAFEELYNQCDAIQFLSPLHRQVINQIVRIEGPRQYEVGSPISLEMFRSLTPFSQRKRAALVTGDAARVAPTAVRRAEEQGYRIETLRYLSVPHDQMPGVLNEYQAVVVDPVMIHAFGRIAVEAMACGCQVIASPRVGAMSWPDPIRASQEANGRFWDMVLSRPDRPNPRRMKSILPGRWYRGG